MLAISEYRCLDQLVLGKEQCPIGAGNEHYKFDEWKREVAMLIKLFVIEEMLPEVQIGGNGTKNWTSLKDLHQTSDKGTFD